MYIRQQGTRRRSNVTPTTGYVQRLIKDAIADGSQLKLFEMEQRNFVTYNPRNGNYTLTEEGRKFLMGGQR